MLELGEHTLTDIKSPNNTGNMKVHQRNYVSRNSEPPNGKELQ